jgi:hypothetical protein
VAWHERGVTIAVPDEGIVLEGLWRSGTEGAAVVAPPHPKLGGSLDNPVVSEIAYALHRAGYATLRFNWRGVGASQGRVTGDPAAAVADYRAALRHLRDTLELPVIGAGYSFGAAATLRVALEESALRGLVLVAPPLELIREIPLERIARPIHVIVGGRDAFAPIDAVSELLAPLANARLEVIPKADHFFAEEGLAEICELAYAAVRR